MFSITAAFFFCFFVFCVCTSVLISCKKCINNKKNSLLSLYVILWLINSEINTCKISDLQFTVSATKLNAFIMLHFWWTNDCLLFCSLNMCQLSWDFLNFMLIYFSQVWQTILKWLIIIRNLNIIADIVVNFFYNVEKNLSMLSLMILT